MSPRSFVRSRRRRHAAGPVVAAVVGAVLAAGCTAGSAAPSPSPASAVESAPTTLAPSAPPTPSPTVPTSSQADLPASPPRALLADADEAQVAGTLGSYTWGNGGSDSPWIVVRAGQAAGGTGPWTLSFAPEAPVGSWTATWAAIRAGRPGEIEGYEQGASGPVTFTGPAVPGPWTLKVQVTFVRGGSAAYYWRLEPAG